MNRVIVKHLTAGIVLMSIILTGCKPTKPSSDVTPPVIKWHVLNSSTGDSIDIVGDGIFYAKPDEAIAITLKVEDPEGVSYIWLGGGGTKSCQAGELANNTAFGLGSDEQYLSPSAQGKVEPLAFMLLNVIPETDCSSDFSFVGSQMYINGKGRNYFSGEANSILTLSINP